MTLIKLNMQGCCMHLGVARSAHKGSSSTCSQNWMLIMDMHFATSVMSEVRLKSGQLQYNISGPMQYSPACLAAAQCKHYTSLLHKKLQLGPQRWGPLRHKPMKERVDVKKDGLCIFKTKSAEGDGVANFAEQQVWVLQCWQVKRWQYADAGSQSTGARCRADDGCASAFCRGGRT